MGKEAQEVIVGYQYHMGLHFVVCHGPIDELTQIVYAGDKEVWSGSVTESDILVVDQKELLGGSKREGGVEGVIDVMFGEDTQQPNSYMRGLVGGDEMPAYRGVFGLVLRQFYFGNNPYIKKFGFRVKRFPTGFNDTQRIIGRDANPAHIVFDCLTNPEWGMGYPASAIDLVNFTEVSETLFDEAFGLSFLWAQQAALNTFISTVMTHIGGVLRLNPVTGQFQIKLVRDDYDHNAVQVIAERDIIDLASYQRPGWGEVINEITVKFSARDSAESRLLTIQNAANIEAQGAIVSQSEDYLGVYEEALAQRIAQRQLNLQSLPLSKISLVCNRAGTSYQIGDVFSLSWPKLGIGNVIFRITRIDYGTLEDNRVQIEAVEDVFSLPTQTYIAVQPVGWTDPRSPPAPSPRSFITELPYHVIAVRGEGGDSAAQALDPLEDLVGLTAARPSGDASTWTLARLDGAEFTHQGETSFMVATTTVARATPQDTAVRLASAAGINRVNPGTLAVFLTGGDRQVYEYVEVVAVDLSALGDEPLLTMIRGVHDTVPQEHRAGTEILLLNNRVISDEETHATGTTLTYRQLVSTSQGTLDLDDAPDIPITVRQRQERPLPPGQLRVNTVDPLGEFTGAARFEWAHRDRLQQTTGDLITQDDGNVGPEPGTTYSLKIYGETGLPLDTVPGITDTFHDYTISKEEVGAQLEFRTTAAEPWRSLAAWREVTNTDTAVYDDEASVLAAQIALFVGDNAVVLDDYTTTAQDDPYRRVLYEEKQYRIMNAASVQLGLAHIVGETPKPGYVWSDDTRTTTMVDPAGIAVYRLNGALTAELWSERDGIESWQRQRITFRRSVLTGSNTPIGGLAFPDILGSRIVFTSNRDNHPTETYIQFREMQFRPVIGVGYDHTADTPFSSPIYSASYPAPQGFDGLDNTHWVSAIGSLPGAYLGVLHANPVRTMAAEILIHTDGADLPVSPGVGVFQISYDTTNGHDGVWKDVQQFNDMTPALGDNLLAVTAAIPAP